MKIVLLHHVCSWEKLHLPSMFIHILLGIKDECQYSESLIRDIPDMDTETIPDKSDAMLYRLKWN